MKPRLTLFLLLFILGLVSSGTARDRPNILWITCEDMSPFLGCYGDEYAYTPNLDTFSQKAIRYTNAWSTMPICAPARSTLVTGAYSISLGSMNLRSVIPQSPKVNPLPVLLREAGYYCTNNRKTDYNFSPEGLWDENSGEAHWRNRPDPDQPFYHVVNFQETHEGHTNSFRDVAGDDIAPHDPARAPIPPHLPDTPGIRNIVAHHYDLITAMDAFFGSVLADLEADGLKDNTIIFFFSDHGSGFPRYKRWLYETGLKVPLMVHIPEKWAHLAPQAMGTTSDARVGFVDLPATTLKLAGLPPLPAHQGQTFLGGAYEKLNLDAYNFGARDRADDVEDLSRCVRNERYLYIRNYMPFRPYLRNSVIFSDTKGSVREVRQVMESGKAPAFIEAMFQPKPHEELYDLWEDPNEMNNLAEDPAYAEIKADLHQKLNTWTLEIRDAAFLAEGEMMRRGAHDSIYDMAQDPKRYALDTILEAAETASHPDTTLTQLRTLAHASDNAVRHWAALGLLGRPDFYPESEPLLSELLTDRDPSVSIVAAEALLTFNPNRTDALDHLLTRLEDFINTEPAYALRAARALAEVGTAARPALPRVQAAFTRIQGPVWGRYANWYYPMFIGMALDKVQINLGVEIRRY